MNWIQNNPRFALSLLGSAFIITGTLIRLMSAPKAFIAIGLCILVFVFVSLFEGIPPK